MFYITLCGTIIPCAFKFGDPRENSLFVAVLTSNCNFFLLKGVFPCVYVPGSARIGAWVFQGDILDEEVKRNGVLLSDGHFLSANPVVHALVISCPQLNPSDVSV